MIAGFGNGSKANQERKKNASDFKTKQKGQNVPLYYAWYKWCLGRFWQMLQGQFWPESYREIVVEQCHLSTVLLDINGYKTGEEKAALLRVRKAEMV